MKFDLSQFNASSCEAFPDRKFNYRPVIPVHLYNVDLTKSINYYVLLDSGADYNLFHAEIGELIGIDNHEEGKEQLLYGIEGEGIKSYFHDIVIEIGGWKYKTYSGFTDFGGSKLNKMPYGLLGQEGFFNYFKVNFDYQKLEIEIKPKDHSVFISE